MPKFRTIALYILLGVFIVMSLYTFEIYNSSVDSWGRTQSNRLFYNTFYTDFLPAFVFTILLGIYIFRTYVLKTNEKPKKKLSEIFEETPFSVDKVGKSKIQKTTDKNIPPKK